MSRAILQDKIKQWSNDLLRHVRFNSSTAHRQKWCSAYRKYLLTAHNQGHSSTTFHLSLGEFGSTELSLIAYVAPVIFRDITVGYVLLSFDYSLIRIAKQETIITVASTIGIMLLLAIALSIYLGSRFTRPIRELVMASNAFANGRFDYRIQATREDELGILMQALNNMGEGLQRKVQGNYSPPTQGRR